MFAAGISAAHFFEPELSSLFPLFAGFVVLWIISEFPFRRKYPLAASRMAIVCYHLLIFSSGMALLVLGEYSQNRFIEKTSPIHLYAWESIKISGETESAGTSSSGRSVYIVNVDETEFPEGGIWKQSYKLRLYGNRQEDIQTGQKIAAHIRLYEFPERRNPHEFDYGGWLHQQQIASHGELDSLLSTENKFRFGWQTVRTAIYKNTEKVFSREHASLVKALVLGDKEELTPETKQHFSRAGLSHIMAVSGLHVGFIVAPFWLLIPYLWHSKKGKWLGLLLLTLILTGYAGLTGFSASVSRASLMAWLLTYGRLFHKVRNSVNLTAIAAILLLLMNPRQFFDVGFQLSFSAVFIILLVMPEAQRLIPAKYRFGKAGGLLTIIIVSVVVQAGLFPLLIYYFGEFSIIGPVANALVVPLLSVTVPAALVYSLGGTFELPVVDAAVIPIQFSLDWIQTTAEFLGSLEASYITLNHQPVSLFFIWTVAITGIAALRLPNIRWKILAVLLLAMNLYWVELSIRKGFHQNMEITFLDVGQGDAAHIKTPNGRHILVDAGRWSPMGNSGDQVLIPYLKSERVKKIDALILSHPHADHIGGVASLIKNVQIDHIYQSSYEYDSELYKQYMQLAKSKQIPVSEPVEGEMISADPAVKIFVLGPESGGAIPSNPNNHSLVFKIVYGNTSLLFSGDAEKEQEAKIAQKYGDFLRSEIYKVGHHASNTSSTERFIDNIQPDITVASLAYRNYFGHPGIETVERLNKYGNRQNYTSLTGAIRYHTNGSGFEKLDW
ncbi:MAG: DNA internalization-related competence protein ComEC/Rec2 [Balneolaceae bacterium]